MVPGSHAGPPPPMAHTAAPALATQPAPAAPGGVPVLESSAVAVPKQTTKESPYGERSTASLLQGITGVVAVGDQPPAPSSLGAQPPQPAAAPALHALALPATPPGLPAAPTGPHTSWTRAGGPPVGQLASVPELSMLSMPRPGSTVMLAGAPVLNARLPRMAQQHEAAAQHRQQMLMLLQQQQLAQTAAGLASSLTQPPQVEPSIAFAAGTATQGAPQQPVSTWPAGGGGMDAGLALSGCSGTAPVCAARSASGSSAGGGSATSSAAAAAAAMAAVVASASADHGSPSQQLAQAAAATQQVAVRKQAEQQAAATTYQSAVSQVAAFANQAVVAAQHAAAAYSAAGTEAIAAQETSSQLQQAAAATAMAEASPEVVNLTQAAAVSQQVALQKQAEQAAAADSYLTAARQAAVATDAVSAGQAVVAAQHAAQVYAAAGTEAATAQAASTQLQRQAATVVTAAATMQAASAQHLSFTVPAPTVTPITTQTPASSAAHSTAAAQLAGAAAAAQQVHAQKAVEQQAAAAAYSAATTRVAAASSLLEQAHAAVAVQHAAAAYTAAAKDARTAATAAQQLHQAAAAAATVPACLLVPASAPLAASIAAGALLPGTVVHAAAQQLPSGPVLPLAVAGPSLAGFHGATAYPAVATPPAAPASVAAGSSIGSSASTLHPPPSSAPSSAAHAAAVAAAAPQLPCGPPPLGGLAPALTPVGLVPGLPDAVAGVAAPAPVLAVPLPAPGLVPDMALPAAAASAPHVHWAASLSSASGGSALPAARHSSPPPSAYRSVSAWSRDAAGIAHTAKLIVSSGGAFVHGASGGNVWEYEGGETRLVSVPFRCGLQALVEALDRTSGSPGGTAGSSAESASDAAPRNLAPKLKYRLPSDPGLWVDLLDDDDAALMWDEWDDARSGGAGANKLHLFVQWHGPHDVSLAGSDGQTASGGQVGSEHDATESHISDRSRGPQDEDLRAQQAEASQVPPFPSRSHAATIRSLGQATSRGGVDLGALVDRMELIAPEDVQLVRFLGSGGFGDVWLGRWNGVEVAVKSLSPSLVFGGGEFSSVNRGAIVDLIKEADILASLRHPNVWVFGVVLPRVPEQSTPATCDDGGGSGGESGSPEGSRAGGAGDGTSSSSGGDVIDAIARRMRCTGLAPGAVRPPALVTEYMAGGSLKSALARKADIVAGPLTRVVLALDTAKGVDYLHSKSLVHFDLKSANVLLGYRDRRPQAKIADFGLSKQKLQTYVSGVSSQRGTLPWTAPEILRTPEAVTEKADVFSFAVVMWELWTGQEPFAGMNYLALMMRLANPRERLRPPVPGTSYWEGDAPAEPVPGWRVLMERCWADDPTDRPAFPEIIQELRAMASAIKPRRNS